MNYITKWHCIRWAVLIMNLCLFAWQVGSGHPALGLINLISGPWCFEIIGRNLRTKARLQAIQKMLYPKEKHYCNACNSEHE